MPIPSRTLARRFLSVVCFVLFLSAGAAFAQTPAITYQGRLTDGGTAANGIYDMQFKLYDTATVGTGALQGSPSTVTNATVQVTNGGFTVQLDFGAGGFPGADRFLEINVRHPGDPSYTPLSPRQQLTSSPYSIRALSATSADGLSSLCLGCVDSAKIANGTIVDANVSNSAAIAGSKISGNIAGNAANVTGTVAIANGGTGSSTQSFVDLSTNQNVGGTKTFTGTLAGNGSGLTNLNGANITNNTINASALASDTFPNQRNLSLLGSLRWDLLGKRIVVGSSPRGVAFDGANIWVANSSSDNVMKLRASDGVILGTFAVGDAPLGVAFDGANVWVTNAGTNNVTKLRASDGACVGTCTFAVGTSPLGVAFDGANIWVANQDSNNVTKLRASDGAVQGTFAVGTKPWGVAFDGENIWVANLNSNNVTKLQASDGAVQLTLPVGSQPTAVAFDGGSIWVANRAGNSVTKIRATDGVVQGTFTAGLGLGASGLAFDGANIWVANQGNITVTKLRASDGACVGTCIFRVGNGPDGIAFDGASIWVAVIGPDTVVKLPVFP